MIAVSGPRGTIDKPRPGQMCEDHDTVPAVWCVITEPSIFGAEWTPMCRECYERFVVANKLTIYGWCEECEQHHGLGIYPHPQRGMIRVCHDCDCALDEAIQYEEYLALEAEREEQEVQQK